MKNSKTINSKKFKIVITGHGYGDLNVEEKILREIGGYIVNADKFTKKELEKEVKSADALIVGDTDIDKKLINLMNKCKVISEYGIGVDNIDIVSASEHKIVVANVPGYGTGEVADQAIAILMTLARKICRLNYMLKTKGWAYARRNARPIYRLRDKVLGVVGFGRIGAAFAERAKPIGFKILVYDPYVKPEVIKEKGFFMSSMDKILKESDFISLHLPLTKESKGLIGKKEFKLMKKTAYIINAARGAILDEDALLTALKEKWISGAGLDVLMDYNPPDTYPLINYAINNDNLLIVPHTAWYSEESELELRTRATKAVVNVLMGKKPESQVNAF